MLRSAGAPVDWIANSRTGMVQGMAGELTIKGRQTRQRIVAAAAELMFEGGVAGTTMEDVRAGRRGQQLADLPLLRR